VERIDMAFPEVAEGSCLAAPPLRQLPDQHHTREDQVPMASGYDLFHAEPARVWNAVLGGKDNRESDRHVVREVLKVAPDFELLALASEVFRENACKYLAGKHRVDQFLDFGLGLPTDSPLHEVVRELRPKARVVYVEQEPVALVHAQSLADDCNAFAVAGDMLNPEQLLDDQGPVWKVLDARRPVALLHTAPLRRDPGDVDELAAVMQSYLARVAPGSFIVISHLLDPETPALSDQVRQVEKALGAALDTGWFRTRDQIARLFTGHDLLEPGIVACRQWLGADDPTDDTIVRCVVGGIGQKPPADQAHDPDDTTASTTSDEETRIRPAPADPEPPIAPRAWVPVEVVPEPLLARTWTYGRSRPADTTAGVPEGIPLRELPQALPTRILNLLTRQDLVSAEQIAVMTNEELLDLPNAGLASVRAIRAATMNALAAPHAHGKTVRLSTKQLRALMVDLISYAREDENEELVSRAQELREVLSPESPARPGRQRSAPLMGWIYREHVPAAAGLLAELRLYAYQQHDSEVFDSTTELLDKLAPGFPTPRRAKQCRAVRPDPPRPAGNGDDRQPRPHLQLVSAQPEAATPQ
jgi:hypothetical protein